MDTMQDWSQRRERTEIQYIISLFSNNISSSFSFIFSFALFIWSIKNTPKKLMSLNCWSKSMPNIYIYIILLLVNSPHGIYFLYILNQKYYVDYDVYNRRINVSKEKILDCRYLVKRYFINGIVEIICWI